MRYTANLGDMSTRPDEKCYCPTPDTCLKRGLFDLTKCVGKLFSVATPIALRLGFALHDSVSNSSRQARAKGLY